jgi:uncharacterized protein (TIGR02453 family)
MADGNPFGPGLLRFLRALERRNERAWFDANKQRYEDEVREPALQFIRSMRPKLAKISPFLVANDRKVGGSLMRVYRDVRFSKDKRPFKTNLGIQFRHVEGKDVHAPGLYFHVQPGTVFLGAGMWHPEAQALAAVRAAIDRDPKTWKRVRDNKRFKEQWELRGDSLKRPPRGFDPDHPMIEDLRRKDHIAICDLDEQDLARPDLVDFVAGRFRATRNFMAWQAAALAIPF